MLVLGYLLVNGFQDKIYQNILSSNMYQVKRMNENNESEGKSGSSHIINANNWLNNSIINMNLGTMRRINHNSILPEFPNENDNVETINRRDTASL